MANVAEKFDTRVKIKPPSFYNVIVLNDDFTSMNFVVMILVTVFQKSEENAVKIMLDIHKKGSGLAGTYSKDIAETKIQLVHNKAREAGFPLRCYAQKV